MWKRTYAIKRIATVRAVSPRPPSWKRTYAIKRIATFDPPVGVNDDEGGSEPTRLSALQRQASTTNTTKVFVEANLRD